MPPTDHVFLKQAEGTQDAGYQASLQSRCRCWAPCCDDTRPNCGHGQECTGE